MCLPFQGWCCSRWAPGPAPENENQKWLVMTWGPWVGTKSRPWYPSCGKYCSRHKYRAQGFWCGCWRMGSLGWWLSHPQPALVPPQLLGMGVQHHWTRAQGWVLMNLGPCEGSSAEPVLPHSLVLLLVLSFCWWEHILGSLAAVGRGCSLPIPPSSPVPPLMKWTSGASP